MGGSLDPHSRFDAAAESYDRFRPGYPREAIEWLTGGAGVSKGDAAIDLGAGTGLMSARLVELGLEVTAVEPSEQMRSRLAQRVPEARVLAGSRTSAPRSSRSRARSPGASCPTT